jgi:hypothetical protein
MQSAIIEFNPKPKPCPVLMKAAEIIRERGWTQNSMSDSYGRVCALKAIFLAQGNTNEGTPAIKRFVAKIIRSVPLSNGSGYDVTYWNDKLRHTQYEVIEKFIEAANS